MSELKVVMSPGASSTRVIAIEHRSDGSETLLKARLLPEPCHPRAVQWLLEALALWQGTAVRAALHAGKQGPTYVTRLYPSWFTDFGSSLYSLELVEARPRRVHRDGTGLRGDFRDLRPLTLAMEGAR